MKYVILLLALVSSAALAGWHSVMVPSTTRIDIEYFHSNGYDIEAVFGSKVRLYVNELQETALRNMGYRLFAEEIPAPIVPYPTIAEINASMNAVVAAHPTIARIEQIGTSVQGKELYAVIVSDNVSSDEAEPEIRISGNIHGDEKTAGMSCLNFLEVLTDNYGTSDVCTYVVDNSELWIIPIVNPDGYASSTRYNANSIDLNRNCSYMGPGSGGGSTAFSEPETAAMRDITMQSWPALNNYTHPFATGLSFHSGAECVNCVWNFSVTEPIQDLEFVTAQGNAYANHPSISAYYGAGVWDVWIPGASWYPTNGDVNDWSYGEVGTVDHTIEVSNVKSDPDWPGIANANYMPMLEFCVTSTYGVYGTVKDGGGAPLDALIEVEKTDGTDSSPLRFCRSDVVDGGYSKALVPGTYNIVATVAGLGSQSQNGVVVGSEEMVPVNFVFSTGIGDSASEGLFVRLSVAPNPVTNACIFTLPDTGIDGSLKIYDISGRTVYEKNISAGVVAHAFNAGSTLPAGVYQVRYISNGLSASTRMVVAD
ncbi:MAG: T9SS type A sorting domain-containing protein [Candidatus Sabulitectum sp.]|nr:T9SS type A sorting domain-containing protein [Candidatus Sabulitectum sp.]